MFSLFNILIRPREMSREGENDLCTDILSLSLSVVHVTSYFNDGFHIYTIEYINQFYIKCTSFVSVFFLQFNALQFCFKTLLSYICSETAVT
jgi:hypothetical protein